LGSIDGLVPDGDKFNTIASPDGTAVGRQSSYVYNTIAWNTNKSVAYPTSSSALSTEDQTIGSGENFWVVVKPVSSGQGEKVALVSVKISSKIVEDLAQANVTRSVIVLMLSSIVLIFLVINNVRLFRSALLVQKLRELDTMKDEFISMASHELRAPITGIRGYLSMVADGSFGQLPTEAAEKVKMVLGESDRLRDLVEDLLEVSRIQQSRIKLDVRSLEVPGIIASVVPPFELQASQKHLQLQTKVPAELPKVRADESRLKQILVNLISNSIKYTPKGSVTISAELVSGKVPMLKIKVADTGMGMSAKDRERLFEKFYRVKNEKTDKSDGTGLGLGMTRELVRRMGGDIYVDSIEKIGTEVSVVLPAARSEKT
ncbi:MAG: HAMP domain-containing sensor histidine kinase, partial [Patescibacteria group bacterium]